MAETTSDAAAPGSARAPGSTGSAGSAGSGGAQSSNRAPSSHGVPGSTGAPDGADPADGIGDAVHDVASLGYEQARDELVEVVRRLEAGGEPLEASLALWERGEALARHCQEWLDGAQARLDAVRADAGEPRVAG